MFPASDRPYFKPPTLEFFFYLGKKISRIQHVRVNFFLSPYLRDGQISERVRVFCLPREKKSGTS